MPGEKLCALHSQRQPMTVLITICKFKFTDVNFIHMVWEHVVYPKSTRHSSMFTVVQLSLSYICTQTPIPNRGCAGVFQGPGSKSVWHYTH